MDQKKKKKTIQGGQTVSALLNTLFTVVCLFVYWWKNVVSSEADGSLGE